MAQRIGYGVIAFGIMLAFVGAFVAKTIGTELHLGEEIDTNLARMTITYTYPWVERMFGLGVFVAVGGIVTVLVGKAVKS